MTREVLEAIYLLYRAHEGESVPDWQIGQAVMLLMAAKYYLPADKKREVIDILQHFQHYT